MSDEGELALATALTSARFGLRERLEYVQAWNNNPFMLCRGYTLTLDLSHRFPFMELSEIEARAIAEVLTEPTNNVVHIE